MTVEQYFSIILFTRGALYLLLHTEPALITCVQVTFSSRYNLLRVLQTSARPLCRLARILLQLCRDQVSSHCPKDSECSSRAHRGTRSSCLHYPEFLTHLFVLLLPWVRPRETLPPGGHRRAAKVPPVNSITAETSKAPIARSPRGHFAFATQQHKQLPRVVALVWRGETAVPAITSSAKGRRNVLYSQGY